MVIILNNKTKFMPLFSAGCLLISSLSYLLHALGIANLWPLTGLALLLYTLPYLHRLPMQVYFLAGFTLLALLLIGDDLDWATLAEGVNRGAFFAFFLLAFALMGEVARSSPMIHRCGEVVVAQPPTRRYAVFTVASHIMSILVSMGTGNLLGTIIGTATGGQVAQTDPQLAQVRRRRMTTAVLRGMSTVALWSPTTLIVGILLTATPGLRWGDVALNGVLVLVPLLFSGWLLDWLTRPKRLAARTSTRHAEFKELVSFVPVVGLIMVLLIGALVLEYLLPVRQIIALLLSVIMVALGWLVLQNRGQGGGYAVRAGAGRLRGSWVGMLNRPYGEVVLVALAGLLASLINLLVSPDDLGLLVEWAGLTEATTLILVSLLVIVLGNVGVTPLITIALAIESVWKIPGMDFDPVLVFLCFSGTWSLYIMSSMASVSLRILTLAMGESVATVVRWNLVFSGFWLLVLYCVVYWLA